MYAIGLLSDSTFRHFCRVAVRAGISLQIIDLRDVVRHSWRLRIPDDGMNWVATASGVVPLDPKAAYYCRPLDISFALQDPERSRWIALLCGIFAWLEVVPGKVVNRPGCVADNASKPLHENELCKLGFRVPRSITSSSAAALRQFASNSRCVSKAIGGQRGDTRLVSERDFDGFVAGMGPVHLQEYIEGYDVRCHVLGNDVFAEMITSRSVDYRMNTSENVYSTIECPALLGIKMSFATRACGLAFAGWDFKIAESDEWYCLEVNPMPGYSIYDARCGEAISRALIAYLGED